MTGKYCSAPRVISDYSEYVTITRMGPGMLSAIPRPQGRYSTSL